MASSFAYFRTTLQALACGIVLALTACTSLPPPTNEINAAQQALARASDADAEQYAADELGRARNLLGLAQSALAERRESEARDLAQRATALAGVAHARSREAVATAELEQRRAEIVELRRSLGMEDAP